MEKRSETTGVILASNSPRRIELIRVFDLPTVGIPPEIDETCFPGEAPDAYSDRVAREKNLMIAASLDKNDPRVVLSGDTVVIFNGRLFGKPADRADAVRMLSELQGKTHLVRSSVVVGRWRLDGLHFIQSVSETRVAMEALSDGKIQSYVDSGDPIGKAGAYAIQNHDFNLIASWDGCYAGVVGFPLCHVDRLLREYSVPPVHPIENACPYRRDGLCSLDCERVQRKMKIERFHVKPSMDENPDRPRFERN